MSRKIEESRNIENSNVTKKKIGIGKEKDNKNGKNGLGRRYLGKRRGIVMEGYMIGWS